MVNFVKELLIAVVLVVDVAGLSVCLVIGGRLLVRCLKFECNAKDDGNDVNSGVSGGGL